MINNSDNQSSPLNCLNYTHILPTKKNSCTQCALFFFVTLFFLFQEVKQ